MAMTSLVLAATLSLTPAVTNARVDTARITVGSLSAVIPMPAVQARPARDSNKNGILIGGGIGLGIGAGMFAYATAVDRNEIDEWAPVYAIGTVVLTGVGALIGWAIDARR
jgi:drug/metabolite transporter (DMT)-like permease